MSEYMDQIRSHYEDVWNNRAAALAFRRGRFKELPRDFKVLRFGPGVTRKMWTYATQCMSQPEDQVKIELHIFAPQEHEDHVELLFAIAHYHRTGAPLGLGHTVNFGRPWWPGSACARGLISLPYLDGPALEWLDTSHGRVRFLWLIPITGAELQFKAEHGLEALEQKFQESKLDYLNPFRPSVV